MAKLSEETVPPPAPMVPTGMQLPALHTSFVPQLVPLASVFHAVVLVAGAHDWHALLVLFLLAGVVESQAFGHLGAFTPLFL